VPNLTLRDISARTGDATGRPLVPLHAAVPRVDGPPVATQEIRITARDVSEPIPAICSRPSGHSGACNGYPREGDCVAYEPDLRPECSHADCGYICTRFPK
jgi:hypothetical protein